MRDSSFKTTARRETLRLMEFGLVCRPYRPCFAKGSIPHQVVGTLWVTPCWGPVHLVRCSGKAWVLPRVQKNNGRQTCHFLWTQDVVSLSVARLIWTMRTSKGCLLSLCTLPFSYAHDSPQIHHRFTVFRRSAAHQSQTTSAQRMGLVLRGLRAGSEGLTSVKTVEKSWESSFNWLVCPVCPIIHHYSRKSRDVNVNFLRSSSCIHLRLFEVTELEAIPSMKSSLAPWSACLCFKVHWNCKSFDFCRSLFSFLEDIER